MKIKIPRVILYPEDLHHFASCIKACYKLYNDIRKEFGLFSKRITIYHLRDYYGLTLEDTVHAVFGH